MLPRRPAFVARPGLLQAVQIQAAVVGALMLRELQSRYGRRGLGFLWLFLEPAVLGVLIATARFLRERTLPAGINIVAFFVIGYVVYYLFRTLVSRAASAYETNEELLAHARVTLEDILVARTLLETSAVMMATAIFVIALGLYTGDWPVSWVQMGLGIVMMGLLAHGFSLFVLSLTQFGVHTVDRIVHPLLYISIIFTGVMYMVWWLPAKLQPIIMVLPFIHIFEFVREGQFGPGIPYHYDLGYVALWIIGSLVYGGFALRRAKPHLQL